MKVVERREVYMHRQTIRTFVEVKGEVAKVLRTDPVLVPKTKRMGGDKDAENPVGRRTEDDV